MKKTLFVCIVILFAASVAYAASFVPSPMTVTGQETVIYNFDGSTVEVPVTITGAGGSFMLSVFTKDKANDIIAVTNGHIGWHYVNKIDTCIYYSTMTQLDIGSGSLTWDGRDNDGNVVAADEYTYYIYGYDSMSQKTPVNRHVATFNQGNRVTIITHEADGSPKANPDIYFSILTKIVVGGDPDDAGLIETTSVGEVWGRHIELDPTNHENFFMWAPNRDAVIDRIGKWKWVPNGEAVLQTDWGNDDGYCSFSVSGKNAIANFSMADLAIVEDYLILGTHDNTSSQPTNYVIFVDMDAGEVDHEVDVSDRWFNTDDEQAGGQASGGPTQLAVRNNYIIMSRFNACYREMIDPLTEEDDDFVVWGNGNGDYVGDHNFQEDADRPWVCNDYNVAPYAYITDADANLFSTFGCFDMGALSFGLIAPDGTGIGYFAFAGETAAVKRGTMYIDYDSTYDGIYNDNMSTGEEEDAAGIWFIGHDSFKGTISSVQVSVEDPSAFSVSQNAPNPFNPTTTINFTLAEAGDISVEVFNAAGQKVDVLADEFMAAGSHSITWDASGFSAGVYFYTVKSGDYSRSMKMTLLK